MTDSDTKTSSLTCLRDEGDTNCTQSPGKQLSDKVKLWMFKHRITALLVFGHKQARFVRGLETLQYAILKDNFSQIRNKPRSEIVFYTV